MSMEPPITALNQIQEDGVIDKYAIGGAIGATFYLEAFNTEDVDVFVFLMPVPGALIVTLTPIYDALKALGGKIKGEHIVIGEWPIQILAAEPGLVSDALNNAIEVPYKDLTTRVFGAEYLCAIALKTGRPKDYARVASFIEEKAVDIPLLNAMLEHYGLEEKVDRVPNWPAEIHPIAAEEWIEWFGGKPLNAVLDALGSEPHRVLYVGGDGVVLDCEAEYVICPLPEGLTLKTGQLARLSSEGKLEAAPTSVSKPSV